MCLVKCLCKLYLFLNKVIKNKAFFRLYINVASIVLIFIYIHLFGGFDSYMFIAIR